MRGISKFVQRGPQQVKNIINRNGNERDLDFKSLEDHVNKIQTNVKNLITDSDKFKKTVESMMKHQEELGKSMLELYKPITNISESPVSSNEDVSRRSSVYSNTNIDVQGDTRKIEIYLEKTKTMNEQILSHIQNVNFHVIEPMKKYGDVIHSVKQVLKKRSHKALDYDRHKDSLDKLNAKQSRSLDEERKLTKTREAFTTAELEFKTYDDQLKQQLPTFFDCSSSLYDSCLITFYSIQKDVFHIMYVYFYEIANECGLNLNADIISQYESKNCAALLEDQKIDNLNRLLASSHISTAGSINTSNTTTTSGPSLASPVGNYGNNANLQDELPSYESAIRDVNQRSSFSRPNTTAKVPPAIPQRSTVQYVTALYDFTAQNAGDISFRRGDKIEIVKKTNNKNEWWTGKINGQVGQFPGNYVE
ncbi:hypothetical protein BCR36DRAFT_348068 [Piromyces finnis]|uniref:BAR-domain-containing protein n=1 Tax=Piromyces finnis TaxID=1754191 RepID=A0A1Y1VGP5_9FUNG|nr:hypothetical protein BCR36DRAFT_348068 [Piromyces finnis]|eukprot:ORX54881.1 hypothetical protein BCR36DRAFT_348068 [Piromyces finnis]